MDERKYMPMQRIYKNIQGHSPRCGTSRGGKNIMIKDTSIKEILQPEHFNSIKTLSGQVKISRRTFVQMLGAGLLITVTEGVSFGQRRSGGGRGIAVAARVQINTDGTITVMTGKVEEGQGSRAELSQA